MDLLSNSIAIPTLIHPVDMRAILNNYKGLFALFDLTNFVFYDFLKVHPLILNDTSMMPIAALLADITLHLKLYQVHSIPMVNTMLPMVIYITNGTITNLGELFK